MQSVAVANCITKIYPLRARILDAYGLDSEALFVLTGKCKAMIISMLGRGFSRPFANAWF